MVTKAPHLGEETITRDAGRGTCGEKRRLYEALKRASVLAAMMKSF